MHTKTEKLMCTILVWRMLGKTDNTAYGLHQKFNPFL